MVEPEHPSISIRRQCELIGLPRSSWYYQSATESELNLELMRLMDELHTATPIYGRDRILEWLRRRGYQVNHKRICHIALAIRAFLPWAEARLQRGITWLEAKHAMIREAIRHDLAHPTFILQPTA